MINESNIHLNPPIYGDGIFVIVEGNLKMGAFAPRVKESVINGFVHIPTILDDDSRAEIVDNISYATVFKEDDLPKMMKWCKNNWKGKTFSIVELEAEFTPVSGEPGASEV